MHGVARVPALDIGACGGVIVIVVLWIGLQVRGHDGK